MAKKRRKTKRQLREERQKNCAKEKGKEIILLTVEIIILAALLVAAYGIFKLGKLDYNVLNKRSWKFIRIQESIRTLHCLDWIREIMNWTAVYKVTVL